MGLNARDLMIAHSHLAHRGLLASSLFVRIRLMLLDIFKRICGPNISWSEFGCAQWSGVLWV